MSPRRMREGLLPNPYYPPPPHPGAAMPHMVSQSVVLPGTSQALLPTPAIAGPGPTLLPPPAMKADMSGYIPGTTGLLPTPGTLPPRALPQAVCSAGFQDPMQAQHLAFLHQQAPILHPEDRKTEQDWLKVEWDGERSPRGSSPGEYNSSYSPGRHSPRRRDQDWDSNRGSQRRDRSWDRRTDRHDRDRDREARDRDRHWPRERERERPREDRVKDSRSDHRDHRDPPIYERGRSGDSRRSPFDRSPRKRSEPGRDSR